MERLILITGYMGFEGGGDDIRWLHYESKEKFLSDIETEYQLIQSELDANPVPNVILAEYDTAGDGGKNRRYNNRALKPKAEFDIVWAARIAAITKRSQIEKQWSYGNVITLGAYASTKAPKEGDWHSIEVYTVEEFFNDPNRMVTV